MARVNLQVDDETKEEWEKHVEESPEFSTLSQLVRAAVHAEVNGHSGDPTEATGTADEEVLDRLSGLKGELRGVKDRLESVEANTKRDPAIEELKSDVFDLLPTEEELETHIKQGPTLDYRPGDGLVVERPTPEGTETVSASDYEGPDRLTRSGRVEAFAHVLGESVAKVEEAAEKLADDTAMVGVDHSGDVSRFYRGK